MMHVSLEDVYTSSVYLYDILMFLFFNYYVQIGLQNSFFKYNFRFGGNWLQLITSITLFKNYLVLMIQSFYQKLGEI